MKKIIALPFFLILVLFVESAMAVEFTNYNGTFVRGSGAPITETVTFPGIEGTGVLRIYNGAEDDSLEKVSSSIVMVNSREVFSQENFNQNVSFFRKRNTINSGTELNLG